MRIRFIKTFATDRECFVRGSEEDLPDEIAKSHIDARLAVPADDAEQLPKAKNRTAQTKAR
jgi:hypothetical protein